MDISKTFLNFFILLCMPFLVTASIAQSVEAENRVSNASKVLNLIDRRAGLTDQLVSAPNREARSQIRKLIAETDRQIDAARHELGAPGINVREQVRSSTATPEFAERQRIADQYEVAAERRSNDPAQANLARLPIIQSDRKSIDHQKVEPPVAPDAATRSPRQSQ